MVGLSILPGFAGLERHHVHTMEREQFNPGNHVPYYASTALAGPEPVATLILRLTGVDIGQCPVCHAGACASSLSSGRAKSRPQPWTSRASARRVPLAPRVSAGPPEARTASPGPRSTPVPVSL